MTHHYRVFPKALTVAECQAICKLAAGISSQSGTVGFGGKSVVNQNIRESDVCWLPRMDPDLQWLWNKISFYSHKANFENFGCIDSREYLDVQFTTYEAAKKGHYGWHQDSTAIVTDNRGWDRKLSVCIQLSEQGIESVRGGFRWRRPHDKLTRYEGGKFWVNPGRQFVVEEFKDAGDLIVFPSNLWHQVEEVTSGCRHSLVTWTNGPRWR